MTIHDTEFIVVGAGLSGLTTARRLADAGRDVVVLEGNDRVGGRTCAQQIGKGTFDVGGQWIGPQQKRMLALVDELGIATFPTYDEGTKLLDIDGDLSSYDGAIPSMSPLKLILMQKSIWQIDRAARKIPIDDPWRAPNAAELDSMTLETWKRRHIPSAAVRGAIDAAIRVVFGAEASELSMLHVLWYIHQGGSILKLVEIKDAAQETRFVHGSHSVSLALAERLGDRVCLSAPARVIRTDDDGVTVDSDTGTWRAKRIVVACPPATAGRIRYAPGLPPLRDALMQKMPMGATIKFHFTYDTPFWRDAGFSGELVCTTGPISVTFDNTSHDGAQPALVGFCVGKAARELGEKTAGERRAIFTDVLVRAFGPKAAEATDYLDKDWSADEWARGCPTGTMPPGVMSVYGPALRAPIGRIHWAGTETARSWTGYMEGAVEAGERAAAELLGSS